MAEVITTDLPDPRLGRRFQPDPRNANFPMKAMLPRAAYETPKSMIWHCKQTLNQGQEGSCVGHGFAHELIARPFPIQNINHNKAVAIYKKAQTLDQWPGEKYSGTSVLAGVQAVQALFPNTIESYRWAFDINDIVATLGYHGPIVIGVNWYSSMFSPDANGLIHVNGNIAGGHCILLRGVNVEKSLFQLKNSWGIVWGRNGDCYLSFDDLNRLLHEHGEFCIPISRGWWKK